MLTQSISIANFLNPEGECVEIPTDDNLVADIVAEIRGQNINGSEDLESKDVSPPLKRIKELKEAYVLVKVDLETHYSEQRSAIRVVASALANLRKRKFRA